MKPRLKFKIQDLKTIALRYQYTNNENELSHIKPKIQKKGFLTKDQLSAVAQWKSPRSAGKVLNNHKNYVQEITSIALSGQNERTRIEVLTLLDGVLWPTASVILHFFHKDPYPIIDYRALWSISIKAPSSSQYKFDFWWQYVLFCRNIAEQNHIDMRTLDRALWQYSKENQKE